MPGGWLSVINNSGDPQSVSFILIGIQNVDFFDLFYINEDRGLNPKKRIQQSVEVTTAGVQVDCEGVFMSIFCCTSTWLLDMWDDHTSEGEGHSTPLSS
jgi:hypothetical protein